MQPSFSALNTHEAFKAFQAVNFTAEQAEVLINLLNEQVAAQSLLLSRDDFVSVIDKKADKDDIKRLIEQMDSRFIAIQQQMDTRFAAVDKRFEVVVNSISPYQLPCTG